MKIAHLYPLLFCCLFSACFADEPLLMFLPNENGNISTQQVVWSTEPCLRYELNTTTNLFSGWTTVPGYPAVADGLAQKHTFQMQNCGFFRVGALDEQPPVIVAQYPASNGFAVGRSADLFVQLEDASGIDAASISLSVGPFGPLTQGAAGLVISNSTIMFDPGATPYGSYGETTTAVLVVADPNGNTLTNIWSFRLETAPETASNLFVFGSPPALALGQKVRGPAAMLSSRYPASSIPAIQSKAQSEWSIESVYSNRIVMTYTGGVPSFAVGQLICNLTPASESEIFYRLVLSISNDAANARLTLYTEDSALTNFVSQGAVSLSANSMILELDQTGRVVKAVNIGGTLTFPRIGFDFSGTEFGLREDGYEITVKGVTYSLGSKPILLNATLTEYSWWLTPRIQAGLELDLQGLKSFEAIVQGDVALANVIEAEVVLIGVRSEITLFDLPKAMEPKVWLYLGQLGPVPVYAKLKFDCSLEAEADAKVQLELGLTYRQDHSASFGLVYERPNDPEWVKTFTHTAPDFRGEAALTGELSFHLTLDPRLEFLVYGLAGLKAAVEPSAGIVTTVPIIGGEYAGKVEADVDFVLGAAGPAFDAIDFEEELRLNIWHGEWPLTPQTLEFKTHPESQTVAPGDAVSFSCTVDAPSTPTFQWYHKGLPIPGQNSRSLFLPRVNAGFAGQYYVSAKAGSLKADSAPATLTVLEVTSENKDTDKDGIPDIYETKTGVWASHTDRGTYPNNWDSDGDGLSDGVENNTGAFVSFYDPGTNPNMFDTDGDGVNDKREIELGTDPNHPPGKLQLSASSYPVGEGDGSVTITVTREGGTDGPASVNYATADGMALGGSDYESANGQLTWAYGDGTAKSFIVPVLNDETPEDSENFIVTLSGANGATLGNPHEATVTIMDNDSSAPAGMVLIPAGSFSMGDNFGGDGEANELPQHNVYVSAFYMDKYEVTKALWDEVKGWNGGNGYQYDNAGSGKAANHPVHTVNWYDVVKWCNARSQKEPGRTPVYYTDAGLTQVYKTGRVAPYVNWSANGYRLPTEAEWEKAARGGAPTKHRFPWADSDNIDRGRANYYSYWSGGGPYYPYDKAQEGFDPTYNDGVFPYTSPVGAFETEENLYGLYDMAGNLWEWCWDWYDGGWYGNAGATVADTRGPATGSNRVPRGGSWNNCARDCRVAYRLVYLPDYANYVVGFRVVLPPGQ